MHEILLNNDWSFKEKGSNTSENVTIPHTVNIEPLDVSFNKQGLFEYEKTVTVPEIYSNQRVFIEFEAVMTNCKVYVNDTLMTEHFGGYLPFSIDITDVVSYENENKIHVIVDNRDDPNTPPGKPTKGLDFLYYGGIYRGVKLVIKPAIYFTHPLDKSVERGGIRIDTDLDNDTATIKISENIKNSLSIIQYGFLNFKLFYDDVCIEEKKEELLANANGDTNVTTTFTLKNPNLWDTQNPNLYTIKTELQCDDITDERTTTFGIRSIKVDENGLYLNDKKIHLFGLNRGQQFPYIGIAASDNAQRREARLLKDSGINCLRLAHYPHSPAFIDECDKIGILLIDPVPGWQFLGGDIWKKRLQENLVELVRRDRNHPSVIIYEVTPNETNWSNKKGDLFLHHLHEIVREECSTALTGGDTVGRKNALVAGFDIPYSGKDNLNFIQRMFHKDNRLQLKREYGDWGFGGNKSTSRVARGDGEKAMQVQTWNYQYAHNDNYREGDIIGDLIWESIDHNRGYYPKAPISKSGIFDVFRIPKLSYQFVRSQNDAVSKDDFVIFLQALSWQDKKKLVFYSNCDKLSLYADGKLIKTVYPDNGEDKPFDKKKSKQINDNYWMTQEDHIVTSEKTCLLAKHTISCMFDGGNCNHINHPPFTFTELNLKGAKQIEVKGFKNVELVKEVIFKQQTQASNLKIEPQAFDIPLCANDNDFIFVHVCAVDENSTINTDYKNTISLKVDNGSVIGHSEIQAEIGVAGFMVKADKGAKEVTLTATDNQNLMGKITIKTK